MDQNPDIAEEVGVWFSEYFRTFVEIGATLKESRAILGFWSVPLHSSDAVTSKWLKSAAEVVEVLGEMQRRLKQKGYTNTVILDQKTTLYNANASRIETIMSRRRADGAEVDRAAVSFEIRRTDGGWIIISTAAQPTDAGTLQKIW